MKISHKLVGSFIGISFLTGVVGAVAIIQSQKIAANMAIAEAEHVAQAVAISSAYRATKNGEAMFSDELKRYITLINQLQHRDVILVNRQKIVIADSMPAEIGTQFTADEHNEVQQTMADGLTRTFVERSAAHPQGIQLIVVPMKINQDKIVGAVILEYSSLYAEAIAQARPTMIIIALTSLSCLLLALFAGLRIAHSIAKPLQSVTQIAQAVTQNSNFDLQAPVTTQDETGVLALALNDLIQRVKTLLHEKEQHSTELQTTLNELQQTQLQLVQTEKMSSLGQLVAGVAHEINNPVNFIHGNITHIATYTRDLRRVIQTYQSHYQSPPPALQAVLDEVEMDFLDQDLTKLLQSMKVGTDRIREIVLSLRNFSRLDEAGCKAVDLHEGIDNTLVILRQRLKANMEHSEIQIVKAYGQLPLVECYAGQLNQVFMNLLSNAIDALEEHNQGKSLAEVSQNPPTIQITTTSLNQHRVAILITDNGPGMSESVRSRLFDPFFTTKPVGKGTGLGLSISYQIVVDKHGGKLWCDSTPGQGTKFGIEIPIRQHQLERSAA